MSRMILAGTSERGVCPECGGPWVRETIETHDAEGGARRTVDEAIAQRAWSSTCETVKLWSRRSDGVPLR